MVYESGERHSMDPYCMYVRTITLVYSHCRFPDDNELPEEVAKAPLLLVFFDTRLRIWLVVVSKMLRPRAFQAC